MRFRKARGKKKAVVTMTESEIVEACHEYMKKQGFEIGGYCWVKIDMNDKPKGRRTRVEFVSEVE
jgi:hypothetical protein